MALDRKSACEKCDGALPMRAEACLCGFDCTFCSDGTTLMVARCQSCGGERVRRPKRER
ncbi:MAG: DUF1272 domain-containing protein [Myxococcota bacterium]